MALYRRNGTYHCDFSVNGQRYRQILETSTTTLSTELLFYYSFARHRLAAERADTEHANQDFL
jgi:hypothetical protein